MCAKIELGKHPKPIPKKPKKMWVWGKNPNILVEPLKKIFQKTWVFTQTKIFFGFWVWVIGVYSNPNPNVL